MYPLEDGLLPCKQVAEAVLVLGGALAQWLPDFKCNLPLLVDAVAAASQSPAKSADMLAGPEDAKRHAGYCMQRSHFAQP